MKIYLKKITPLHEKLNEKEMERILNFKSPKAQLESVNGLFLLTESLKKEGIHTFEIIRNSFNKPYLKDSPLYYSLSHSFEYVVCVLSWHEVGIDIQKKSDVLFNLKRRTFETSNDLDVLTRNWTLKEAYSKCVGRGLGIPFKDIEIKGNNPYVLTHDTSLTCHTIKYEGYYISVCLPDPRPVKLDLEVIL